MSDVSFAVAFGAGLLSFLSPCVLPLIPGYLSFVSGASAEEIRDGSRRAGVFYRTLFFTLGFSAVFTVLGLVFSGGGMIASAGSSRVLSIVAGVVVVVLGLNMMFDVLRFLNAEAKAHVTTKPTSAVGAFVVGMAFGAGWTPCIGPILASILLMAAKSGAAIESVLLLGVYSAGLAVPFLAAGLFFDRLTPVWTWFKRHGGVVRTVSGLLLVAIGLSMVLGKLTAFNAAAVRLGIGIKAFLSSYPDRARMWTAGTLAAFAAALVVLPLVRGRKPTHPARLVVLACLVVLIVLEGTGVLSIEALLSDWMLFQGA